MAQLPGPVPCLPWPEDQEVPSTSDLINIEVNKLTTIKILLRLRPIGTDCPVLYTVDPLYVDGFSIPGPVDLDFLAQRNPGVSGLAGAFYAFKFRRHLIRLMYDAMFPEDRERIDTVGSAIIWILEDHNDWIVNFWNTHVPELTEGEIDQLKTRVMCIASGWKAYGQV
jgi:hypothetical protein